MAIDPYLVAATALCLLVHLLLHRFLRKSPSRFPYPPGPRGLPILGSLLLVGASAHSSLARLAERYGPIMFLRLGSHGCVVASNADAARAFLKTVDAQFANRPDPISARDVSYQRQNLVMADYTPTWKLLRKMCSLHLLGGKAFADWAPVRRDEFRRMARSLHGLAEAGEPVELMDVLVCTLANVVGLILVSRRVFDAHGEESNKFKDILVDMLTGGAQFNIGDFFPSIAWMDLQGIQKKMLSVHLRFDAMVTKLFEEHEAAKGERQGRMDFIDKVMANKVTEDGETISEVNVKALIFDLEWVIDTGASYHATPRREFFATYRSGNFGVVKMGNYGTADIIGMGDIHLKTNLGCKLVLKDVRHVVDLRLNLISVGRLDDEDYESRFHRGQWKLSKGSLVIANGKKCHTLYRLQAKAYGEQLNATEKDFSMELGHRRLGHMSEKGLQTLSKREVLPDLRGHMESNMR
ncbi:flavonoid 3',5'-hydroxylase 1-like isoform X3 [Musa acuminata AAA Group]|uniref:flavonoid 3',5'-hydroxylase 1-like isoform X3 n=1 Tax=Musa acuminata AAA Group TaxID=214697 RepID=UPI0031DA5A37